MSVPVLEVEDLVLHYVLPRRRLFGPAEKVYAVNGVSFAVGLGESFGIVGESGCGKSTLARAIMALETPTSGSVRILGDDLAALGLAGLRAARRRFQMVFQDPYGSLDPRHRVGRIVGEPLDTLDERLSRPERMRRVEEALRSVGLKPADTAKYPHEFSGGQRQRIAIARAIVTRPALVVADEPISALDVSIQAQVLNLLRDLQRQSGVSLVFISHDLAVVEYICDEAAVMYLGHVVEQGPTGELFSRPAHPYTRELLDSVPQPLAQKERAARTDRAREPEQGHRGCVFAGRCPLTERRCLDEAPALRPIAPSHWVSCHFADSSTD